MQENTVIKLDTQAVFEIGDIIIIASATYSKNEQNCFDKISDILKEKVKEKAYK